MSYVKRQELFKDVNPLMKKYKYEGALPPSYIPPKKRKIIARYMGRSSFSPGFYGKYQPYFYLSYILLQFSARRRCRVWPSNHEDGCREQSEER